MDVPFLRTPFASVARGVADLPSTYLGLLVDEACLEGDLGAMSTGRIHCAATGDGPLHLSQLVLYPIDLQARRFTVGRHVRNDVVIHDRRVSGFHAMLEPAYQRTYWLSDVGSSNGTSAHGKALTRGYHGRVMLTVGTTFHVGGLPIGLVDRRQIESIIATSL